MTLTNDGFKDTGDVVTNDTPTPKEDPPKFTPAPQPGDNAARIADALESIDKRLACLVELMNCEHRKTACRRYAREAHDCEACCPADGVDE